MAETLLVAISSTVETEQMAMKVTATASAFLMELSEMLRPKTVAERLFLTVAKAEQRSTATVTVFIPPAVPTGEPPMTISSTDRAADAPVRFS